MSIGRAPAVLRAGSAADSTGSALRALPAPASEAAAAAKPPCKIVRRDTPVLQPHGLSFFMAKSLLEWISGLDGCVPANRTLFQCWVQRRVGQALSLSVST